MILFGSLLVLALAGTLFIDAKRKRNFGEQWDAVCEGDLRYSVCRHRRRQE